MALPDSILRAYDIRGVVDETITTDTAYVVGRSFAAFARVRQGKTIVVGRDGRLSSSALHKHLIQGLTDSGMDVTDIGLCPSPVLHFSQKHLSTDAAIMVTGSHNPPNYNGFKMALRDGPLKKDEIKSLAVLSQDVHWVHGEGSLESIDVANDYIDYLIQDYRAHYYETIKSLKSLKIAWDIGNGAAGVIMPKIIRKLPGEHILLNEEVNGAFPSHPPDPSVKENLKQLINVVRTQKCDVGFAFDGDADRLIVVDNAGNVLYGDVILAFLAEEVLLDKPGAKIVLDVKASQSSIEHIRRFKGDVVMSKSGHSLIKQKMNEVKSHLAGEMGGHLFFADRYFGYDDGIYAALRFMGNLSMYSSPLERWYAPFAAWHNTPELSFPYSDERKFQFVEEVHRKLKHAGFTITPVDGVRVHLPEGWWLLRASNTQPKLVARAEARTKEGLEKAIAHMNSFVNKIPKE
jgi:phosphomannomutase